MRRREERRVPECGKIYNMTNPELISYIRQALASGAVKEQIKGDLLGAGWSENDVSGGFTEVEEVQSVHAAPIAPPQISQTTQIFQSTQTSQSLQPSKPPQTVQNIQPEETFQIQTSRFFSGWKADVPRFRIPGKMIVIIFSAIAGVALAGGAGYMYF